MLNVTLTITAAPELLAVISKLTNTVTASRAAEIPQSNPAFNSSRGQSAVAGRMKKPTAQQGISTEQAIPTEHATSTQGYTMEQLAVAATQIVDGGRRTELVGLLNSFGVQALTSLPKEQYGAFATELRALGAKI